MKHILVTGATGFIGNYVTDLLLRTGHRVTATSANAQKAASFPWFDRVRYIPFSLEQFDPSVDYAAYFGHPDLLVHLAWEGLPNYKAAFHIEENLPRHFAFLQNLVSNGLTDITITGTCFEYGFQEGALYETLPSLPANAYSKAKNSLREQLELLQHAMPFILKWVRLFYMYGKGQSSHSLLSQLERALENGDKVFNMSGGEQIRDYMPVEKVAANIVQIALQQTITGVVNCCSGQPITVKQLVLDYLHEKQADINLNLGYYPYTDYEPMAFWGSTDKLAQVLGIKL